MLVPFGSRQRGKQSQGAAASPAPAPLHTPQDRLVESTGLARAIGLDVRQSLMVPLVKPRPTTLFGSGKVEEIGLLVDVEQAGLVVVDHAVSPVQQRNLERAWNSKVLDRTGLILEIFGERARTREGRLQVELAHLTYQKSRLVRSWTHLERQRGGFGFLGGPGETQIETDRRLIQERIDAIRKDLEVVVKTRTLHRESRKRVPYPLVAIVGYTNAGKSTLFNRLTGASVLAADQVFATLDPTMREVKLPSGRRIILSDTVGFISDLPTSLVAAFRATLEEVIEADLLLHVRDIHHAASNAQAQDVSGILAELGLEAAIGTSRILEVWNKIDLASLDERADLEQSARRLKPRPVLLSAAGGEGFDVLLAEIAGRIGAQDEHYDLTLDPAAGAALAWLYAETHVLSRSTGDDGRTRVAIKIQPEKRGRLIAMLRREGVEVR